MFSKFDFEMMHRAIDLAYSPIIAPYPNPRVGAVITRGGKIISDGFCASYESPHAEFSALAKLNFKAENATIYVTLEPCCPFAGKRNPSCAKLIAESGVNRCVIGSLHPVKGENLGVELLRQSGLTVEFGLMKTECANIVKGLFYAKQTRKPYVICKWAMTADGLIAPVSRERGAISDVEAKQHTHLLRHQCDCVLVGLGTALNDNPRLDCREAGFRHPTRIVLDPLLELPSTHNLANPDLEHPTLLLHSELAPKGKREELLANGVSLVSLSSQPNGDFLVEDILDALFDNKIYSVLIEGGSYAHGQFFDAKAVDEVHIIVAPKILGGSASLSPVGGTGRLSIANAIALDNVSVEPLGCDILICGIPVY